MAAYIAGMPLLTRSERKAARQFLNEELEHTGELSASSRPPAARLRPAPTATCWAIPPTGPGCWRCCTRWRALQISGYLDWIPRLSPGPVRAAVSSILTVDSQHLAMVRVMQGQVPVPGPFVTGSV